MQWLFIFNTLLLLLQMSYTGSVWPPAFQLHHHVRACQEHRYLTVTPESIITELHLSWRTCCPNRGEAEGGNTIKQRGETNGGVRVMSAFSEVTSRRNPEWIHSNVHQNAPAPWALLFVPACALPACTGAQQHVETCCCWWWWWWVKKRWSSVSICTPVCCCLASLITNGNQSEVSASDFGLSYEQTPEFLPSPLD